MEVEIENYLHLVRRMGIKAWIPGSPGNGPKMSVTDQCKSGVLCLNYKGSDIYIQGNSRRATNDQSSLRFDKKLDNLKSVRFDELNLFGGDLGNTALNGDSGVNITSRVAARQLGRDVGTQWSDNDNIVIDDSLGMSKSSKIRRRFEKFIETEVHGTAEEQKTFDPAITGMQFRRIVREKLTREVRVAKCYVSSLPDCGLSSSGSDTAMEKISYCHLDKKALRSDYTGKLWSSLDCKRSAEIEKSGLSPGFVRQLIKLFDVYDNVEQQCPSHETLKIHNL